VLVSLRSTPAVGYDSGISDMITYENPARHFYGSIEMKTKKTNKTVCALYSRLELLFVSP
jgi:hypothetical protein